MLLDYGFSADPSPIEISTAQVSTDARVNISASAGTAVYCNQIEVAVPVGSDAPSLYSLTPTASVNTNKWSITSQMRKGSELWGEAIADQEYATFTYDCPASSDFLIDYNLVLGVLGQIAPAVGTASVLIQENSGTTADPTTFTIKQGSVDLDKALPQFYLKNLVATAPTAPTVPATDFADGAPIAFAWESNGSYFQLFAKNQPVPVYAGTATTFTLTDGVSRETTFILAASMTGSPGQDTPQGGYEPIYLYDTVTITVSNPVLTPTSVSVADALTVSGQSTLGAASVGALTSASANVSGAVQAGGLATTGGLTVGGSSTLAATSIADLTVTDRASLASASVAGSLSAGSASLSNLTVRGGLNATGAPVSMLGTGKLLASGTTITQTGVQAYTDGFAVAQVLGPGNNGKSAFGYGYVYTIGTWFPVLGGTVGSFGTAWQDVMNNNLNSICIPIQANTYWYYSGANAGGNQMDAPIYIYWFPLGASASGEETYRILTETEAAAFAPAPPAPPADFNLLFARREATADQFVARLEQALDGGLADEVKADLSELLLRL